MRAQIKLQKMPAPDPPRGPPPPAQRRTRSQPPDSREAAVGPRWAGRWKEQRRSPAEGRRGLSLQEPRERTTAERVRRPLLLRVALFWVRSGVGMARGNQRELARQKNMKKSQEISKGKRKEDSLTTSQRKQRDSEIMQQKQKAANEKKSMQTREK
ncbi:small EDRK-rich factor 1 [Panthera onca]|uniref:small EDRK-rich factor 1 n=1 Tax=Panthera onca TaxID=9690 RepID=UPI002953C117|nr:small EDRK-rich factor 1 [Panthera onca]